MLVALVFFKFQAAIVVIFSGFYLLYSLPVIYLHLTYYLVSRKREMIIDNNGLVIKMNSKILEFKHTDFDKVTYYKPTSCYSNYKLSGVSNRKGGPIFFAQSAYSYLRINTKLGKQIIITCLMHENLDEVVKNYLGDIPFKMEVNPFFILRKNIL